MYVLTTSNQISKMEILHLKVSLTRGAFKIDTVILKKIDTQLGSSRRTYKCSLVLDLGYIFGV